MYIFRSSPERFGGKILSQDNIEVKWDSEQNFKSVVLILIETNASAGSETKLKFERHL